MYADFNSIGLLLGVLSPEDNCPPMLVINLKDAFASLSPFKRVGRSTEKGRASSTKIESKGGS